MVASWDGGRPGQPARGGRVGGSASLMDGAYFVGRTTLQLGLSKVEISSARPSPSSRSVLIALVVQQRFHESVGRMRAKRLGSVRVLSP